ncbi:MAG: zinc ribbon domain-containing protein [Ktedonobacteraceae bacterium]|nr:zinc ribbon domain-containing protein [Ktedonobacteraceae bacterium]
MPMYEYLCNTCHHNFEVWQKMTDETLTVCPECGEHIHRVLYPAGIVFKGSGFYKTDHGHGSFSPANSDANKKSEKTEGTATESKTESKSGESKAESKPTESKSSEAKTVKESKVAASASKD